MRTVLLVALLLAASFAPPSSEQPGPQSAPPPQPPPIPAPASVLGHEPGADFFLASYDVALRYFQHLDDASDRVQLVHVGKTTRGLDWYVALISAPENLADLERHLDAAQRLAWARDLSDDEARALSRETKAIVHIDGGLHATEAACAQHTIALAHRLAAADGDPLADAILDQVILVLWFSMNPDGQNMVADWYAKNLGTPYEVSPLPWLYQEYVGHDNNRDGYMNNMVESRVVTAAMLRFQPQVFYNHHQTAPFPARIWIPPFAEPVSSNVHPLMWRWTSVFGTRMAAWLDERGMPGAIHRGTGFDNWYPGFVDNVNSFRNTVAFLTETALYEYATPHFYTLDDFPRDRRDLRAEVFYSSPWRGGWWRIGDAVRYMVEASLSVLDTAARFREELLFNRYQAGRDVIRRYREEPPYAFVIPARQHDPKAAALLVETLRRNGIEVRRATVPFDANGIEYAAGAFVVLMDQPFAALAEELLEVQDYPELRAADGGPLDLPYDVAGWTLPLQMGVAWDAVLKPVDAEVRATLEVVAEEPVVVAGAGVHADAAGGASAGAEPRLVVSRRSNAAARFLNAALARGATVRFLADDADSAVVSGWAASDADRSARESGVAVEARGEAPSGDAPAEVRAPRVALYRPWTASIDEGWTRWVLEQHGFAPRALFNEEVRAGKLRERYDAIVFASMSARSIRDGHAKGTIPPEYAGGIGDVGVANLRAFVADGGTLIAFDEAARFAIEAFHLEIEDAIEDLERDAFFCSGSLLRARVVDAADPWAAGLPAEPVVMYDGGPVFATKDGFEGAVVLRWPDDGTHEDADAEEAGRGILASGFLRGAKHLAGKGALVRAAVGEGTVVLFGFRPQWRGQSHGAFKAIFAALYESVVERETAAGARGGGARDEAKALERFEAERRRVRGALEDLVAANKAFRGAAEAERDASLARFEQAIETFRTGPLAALEDLSRAESKQERRAAEPLAAYVTQLKTLLVDLRSRDLTLVDYTTADLRAYHRLDALEQEIADRL